MTKIAKRIKNMTNFRGAAALYHVEPPLPDYNDKEHSYVVASAVIAPFGGAETYLFPADKDGNVMDWGEMPGSQKGTLSHEEVFEGLGYGYVIATIE